MPYGLPTALSSAKTFGEVKRFVQNGRAGRPGRLSEADAVGDPDCLLLARRHRDLMSDE